MNFMQGFITSWNFETQNEQNVQYVKDYDWITSEMLLSNCQMLRT